MPRIIVFIAMLLLITEASFADDIAGDPSPPWQRLEELIRQEGFETSIEALLDILNNSSELPAATYAATALGLRGEREAISVLSKLAKDRNTRAHLRQASARALGELGEEIGPLVLREMLAESTDLYSQILLASDLARLGYPDGYGHILLALFLGSSNIEAIAFQELFLFVPLTDKITNNPKPKDFILSRLYDRDEWIRKKALNNADLTVEKGMDDGVLQFAICNVSLSDPSDLLRRMAVGTMLSWEPDVLLFCPTIKFRPCWLYECL